MTPETDKALVEPHLHKFAYPPKDTFQGVDMRKYEQYCPCGMVRYSLKHGEELEARIEALEEGSADDLRNEGWAIAVHNDYRLNGGSYTFWLFTKDGRCLKGEGPLMPKP